MGETVKNINIKEQIKSLVQLQAIDTQIYNLEKEKEGIPVKIIEQEKIFQEKEAYFNSLEEKIRALAAKRKERELDLATKEEEVKKFTNQLGSLKTNKEYQAMLTQISSLKSDNSLIEEEILKVMDEQDSSKSEQDKEKVHLAEEEKKFHEEKNKNEQRMKEVDYSINELTAKRNQISPSLDKRILAHYERILKGRDGLALVKVENNACQGCFMNVTHQVINEIKMFEKIVTCGVCARMLYIEEDI